MAAADIASINYAGIQASEFTILPTIRATSFAGLVQIHDDVRFKKQLALLRSGKFAYRTETNAAKSITSNTGGGTKGSQVEIVVDNIYSQESQITADYFEKFIIEQARKGADKGDLTGVEAAEQIIALYSQDRGVDLERLLWAGKKNVLSTEFPNAPGGAPEQAIMALFYGTTNGLMTRMMNKIAAGDIKQEVTISAPFTPATALTYFQTLYAKQSAELRAYPGADKVFVCSVSVADAFLTNREAFTGSDLSFRLQDDGTERMFFRGIEIIAPNTINLMQQEGSWGSYLPEHFVFLMSRDALAIGADAYSPDASVKTWYSEDDDVNYIRSKAAIGTQVVADYMVLAATSTPVPAPSSPAVSS